MYAVLTESRASMPQKAQTTVRIVNAQIKRARGPGPALCLGQPPGRPHPALSAWRTCPARRGRSAAQLSDSQTSPGNLGRPHGTLAGPEPEPHPRNPECSEMQERDKKQQGRKQRTSAARACLQQGSVRNNYLSRDKDGRHFLPETGQPTRDTGQHTAPPRSARCSTEGRRWGGGGKEEGVGCWVCSGRDPGNQASIGSIQGELGNKAGRPGFGQLNPPKPLTDRPHTYTTGYVARGRKRKEAARDMAEP